MAAADIGVPVISTRRLEGTLVAPQIAKPVPNHLSDTKIYSKIETNGILHAKPGSLHFEGYKVGVSQQKVLRIINTSKDNQQMHVLPPSTPFFSISYSKKKSNLVPGLGLDLTVHFHPKEWKYYYDTIRIHGKGEENLLVPVHAYPVMNTSKFPRSLKFGLVPVGQSRTKMFTLECNVPVDFEFQITVLQDHPAFIVHPLKGSVPGNGKVPISVTYAPTEFSTAILRLQLELSQFNSSPITSVITGRSVPGLGIEQKDVKLDKKALQPMAVASSRKAASKRTGKLNSSIETIPRQTKGEVVFQGVRFPGNVDTPSTVAKVLLQTAGKVKSTDLRKDTPSVNDRAASRRRKEALFLQEVQQIEAEEKANRLRWVTKLGSLPMTEDEKQEVFRARERMEEAYNRLRHVPVPELEFSRSETVCVQRRTRRIANEWPSHEPTFDPYLNDPWGRRHQVLQRFAQAARRVLLQLRCQHRLRRIQKVARDLKAGIPLRQSLAELNKSHEKSSSVVSQLPETPGHILPPSLPHHTSSTAGEQKFRVECTVVIEPTIVDVKKQVPFMDLKVPQHYKLLRYARQAVPAQGSYVPPNLSSSHRTLRTGAEDELENLASIPGISLPNTKEGLRGVSSRGERGGEGGGKGRVGGELAAINDGVVEPQQENDIDVPLEREEGGEDKKEQSSFAAVVPPQSLFKPAPNHPLHIFNPTPGVSTYVSLLPHTEATLDHVLLPLPPYPTAKHPQIRLDPLEAIPGVMKWKKFPSAPLVTMEGQRTIASLWRPRRTNAFCEELTPHLEIIPNLMSGPRPDDFVDENSTEELPVPSFEAIQAQVPVSDSNKDFRSSAKSEMKLDRLSHYNQLGNRIRHKLKAMESGLFVEQKLKSIAEDV